MFLAPSLLVSLHSFQRCGHVSGHLRVHILPRLVSKVVCPGDSVPVSFVRSVHLGRQCTTQPVVDECPSRGVETVIVHVAQATALPPLPACLKRCASQFPHRLFSTGCVLCFALSPVGLNVCELLQELAEHSRGIWWPRTMADDELGHMRLSHVLFSGVRGKPIA